jgi:hypothetical protein
MTHVFLTSALVTGEWAASRSGRFTPGERAPGTHSIGWVNPLPVWMTWRSENSCPHRESELRPLGRSALSQSLYRLRYPGSLSSGTF